MNTLFLSFLFLSVFIGSSDMNKNVVHFDNLPKDANGQVLPKCFICENHGADSHLINRFRPDVHGKCYDPILEIEPAYAKAMHDILKKQDSSIEFESNKHMIYRKALTRFALHKVKEGKLESFEEYSKKYSKQALENLFWQGFVTSMKTVPFSEACNWSISQLNPDRFIPEGNENILK